MSCLFPPNPPNHDHKSIPSPLPQSLVIHLRTRVHLKVHIFCVLKINPSVKPSDSSSSITEIPRSRYTPTGTVPGILETYLPRLHQCNCHWDWGEPVMYTETHSCKSLRPGKSFGLFSQDLWIFVWTLLIHQIPYSLTGTSGISASVEVLWDLMSAWSSCQSPKSCTSPQQGRCPEQKQRGCQWWEDMLVSV
jgi:hypothetical protein